MPRFALLMPVLLLTFVLAGCQTGDPKKVALIMDVPVYEKGANQPSPSIQDTLQLPTNYRRLLAEFALTGYMADAAGPAEISDPSTHKTPFGTSTQVFLRFPVRAKVPGEPTRWRCISGNVHVDVLSLNEPPKFRRGRANPDPESCADTLKFTPYPEMDRMAAHVRACRAQNAEICSASPPDGSRKLAREISVYAE